MGRMQTVKTYGRDPGETLTRGTRIDAVTPQVLQKVFKQYFPADRSTVVTLVPTPSCLRQPPYLTTTTISFEPPLRPQLFFDRTRT
jgi:hypothetical protein